MNISFCLDGDFYELPKIDFVYKIRAKEATNCPLPLDKIDLTTCKNKVGAKNTENSFYQIFKLIYSFINNVFIIV